MTDDLGGGKLLDNTLLPYVTEVGTAGHNHDNMPWLLFGGAKTGLQGNTLGDEDLHTVPIAGLFA